MVGHIDCRIKQATAVMAEVKDKLLCTGILKGDDGVMDFTATLTAEPGQLDVTDVRSLFEQPVCDGRDQDIAANYSYILHFASLFVAH